MANLRWLDFLIMLAYLICMVSVGVRFSRKQTSTEAYFVAKRSIPSWAMGFSIVSTLITAITFIAYPGSAYTKDWSLLIPGFMVVGVLALVGAVIIPFYRQVVGMSAYEYFGKRFGRPTRMYASFAFSRAHFSKMGFILYQLALTINSMAGWSMNYVIAVVGVATVFYTLVGGLEAVIWTDVIQGFVLWIGVIISLGYLFFLPPGGPQAVLRLAWDSHKFSLGSLDLNLTQPTVIVLFLYGFFWYLQKYTADQTVVQRYLVAKRDRDAIRGVALGAGLCVPVWALFMLIGTCTWSFYKLTGETLPKYIVKADQVFPYFLTVHLPVGSGPVCSWPSSDGRGNVRSGIRPELLGGSGSRRLLPNIPAGGDRPATFAPGQADRGMLWHRLCVGIALALAHSKGSALSMSVFHVRHRVWWSGGAVPVSVFQLRGITRWRLRWNRGQCALHVLGHVHNGGQTGARPWSL